MGLDVRKDKRFLELRKLLDELQADYRISKKEILEFSEEISIPVSLFKPELGSFEVIVKYLIENRRLGISSVSRLTNRSRQGVWQAYDCSKKKHPVKFTVETSTYDFPVSIISDRKYSVLESIVKFLKEEFNLSYAQISRLLSRDQRTIWTVYNRTKKK
ncbi:MAG: hypothetical protein KAK00_08420 [Nanoarchaeota archaeon]|nr:hypothetical protein [Nanoarchaeota archaeon]